MGISRWTKVGETTFRFTIQTGYSLSFFGGSIETHILVMEAGWLVVCKSNPYIGEPGRLAAEKWLNSLAEEELNQKAQLIAAKVAVKTRVTHDEIFKSDEMQLIG
jgi:hypothetical protein